MNKKRETKRLEEIVKILTEQNKTVSTMESCTGGALANAITNVPGASEILKFSAVTYSNEFKIKMGVPKSIIEVNHFLKFFNTYNYTFKTFLKLIFLYKRR